MSEPEEIPGYREALNEEQRDRAIAILGIPQCICGIECNQLTPLLVERLVAAQSPLINGGRISDAHILQFLWIISVGYKIGKRHFDWFARKNKRLDFDEAHERIAHYLDFAFCDSLGGGECESFASGNRKYE